MIKQRIFDRTKLRIDDKTKMICNKRIYDKTEE